MAKIKEMFNLVKGSLQSSKCTPGEYNFITASKDWKTHNEYEYDCEALIFAAAASGSLGRTHYVNGKFISSDLCFIITPKDEKKFPIDLKFYHIIFNTLKEDIVKNTKAGTSKEAIGLKALGEYELPYIELDKQREISSKFNFTTEISELFGEEISHQLDLIKNLRQAFLREAMQGLLVSNETSDGKTGADLLAEIQAEKTQLVKEKKIKKPKPLAPITDEEIPFVIPENWTWCRLGELAENIVYGTSVKTKDEGEIPVLRMGNITTDGKILFNNLKYTDSTIDDLPALYLKYKDLLFNRTNSFELVGKSAVFNLEEKYTCASYLIIVRFLNINFSDFICSYINSNLCRVSQLEPNIIQQNGQANFNGTKLGNIIIPLPPLEIQERIVAKLDELMGYCDALEEQVKQSQQTNELLLQQVLREALGDKKEKKETNVLKIIPKQCNNVEKTILAGYIINQSNTPDFGKVKFQKILHLTEYHCQIGMNSNYSKKVAGPHDTTLINNLVSNLQRFNFYKIDDKNKKHDFIEMSSSNELVEKFNDMFDDQKKSVNQIIELFSNKSWEFCELISTLYAVWNNRIINKEDITNELLTQDFLKWNESKIKFIDKIDYGIKWIKDHNLEPLGWGNIIE